MPNEQPPEGLPPISGNQRYVQCSNPNCPMGPDHWFPKRHDRVGEYNYHSPECRSAAPPKRKQRKDKGIRKAPVEWLQCDNPQCPKGPDYRFERLVSELSARNFCSDTCSQAVVAAQAGAIGGKRSGEVRANKSNKNPVEPSTREYAQPVPGRVHNGKPIVLRNGHPYVYEPDHPNSDKWGWIAEHRLLVSKSLGRPLRDHEQILLTPEGPKPKSKETMVEQLRSELQRAQEEISRLGGEDRKE